MLFVVGTFVVEVGACMVVMDATGGVASMFAMLEFAPVT